MLINDAHSHNVAPKISTHFATLMITAQPIFYLGSGFIQALRIYNETILTVDDSDPALQGRRFFMFSTFASRHTGTTVL